MTKKKSELQLGLILKAYRAYLRLLFLLTPKLGAKAAFRLFCTPVNKKIRPKETEILARARKSRQRIGNRDIAIYAWGDANAPTVLLVHGWEGNAGSMGGFIEPLCAKGYQVVAFDGPAHGSSTGKRTNMFQFSTVVAAIARQFTPQAVIAHSFGSGASVFAFSRYPNLSPEKIVLVTAADRIVDVVGDFGKVLKLKNKYQQAILALMRKKYRMPVENLAVSQLATDTHVQQALLVHDRDDRILPWDGSYRIARNWKNATLMTTEGKGHYRILWDEEVVGQVSAFVTGLPLVKVKNRAGIDLPVL